ncbi:response regulator [Pseudomonas sp. PH1b]|uniref:response regulator n=1 Tax=Pseudomonas sp. PH1b TaxID=1397282 RepID=UPI00046AEC02|nr:response regulator [Pseudomonas sp. PH1b]
MSNRALRILIADDQHFHRMQIERALNQLNYYRIAPVHRLDELLTLVDYGCDPFDLLIINGTLATPSGFDLLAFCVDNPQIDYTLIYDSQQFSAIPSSRRHKIQACRAEFPDREVIKRLMLFVDPPLFQAPRPDLQPGGWSASTN